MLAVCHNSQLYVVSRSGHSLCFLRQNEILLNLHITKSYKITQNYQQWKVNCSWYGGWLLVCVRKVSSIWRRLVVPFLRITRQLGSSVQSVGSSSSSPYRVVLPNEVFLLSSSSFLLWMSLYCQNNLQLKTTIIAL
jgi:hypothetical protein